MPNVELMLLALGIALIRPLFAFSMMSLAGSKQLPAPVLISVAIILALFVMPKIDLKTLPLDSLAIVPILLSEALLGLAIGFCLQLAITAARIAGEVISNTIGLGFASMLDPEHGHSVPTIAQFLALVTTAVFMAMDGHLVMIRLIADSYGALPPGGAMLSPQAMWTVIAQGNGMFASGFAMAMPVVAATLVVQLAMAVTARMAPALNLFAVGVPATLIGGLMMLALTIPVVNGAARSTVTSAFMAAANVSGARDIPAAARRDDRRALAAVFPAPPSIAPIVAPMSDLPDETVAPVVRMSAVADVTPALRAAERVATLAPVRPPAIVMLAAERDPPPLVQPVATTLDLPDIPDLGSDLITPVGADDAPVDDAGPGTGAGSVAGDLPTSGAPPPAASPATGSGG